MESSQEALDRLRLEVARLRASRERLVLAADTDRRGIERDLHDGPQQDLVALAANLQLARGLVDEEPDTAKALLEEMSCDVRQALDETAKLAHRIYPPLLESGGLAAALRAAAVTLGVPTRVDVATGAAYPKEVAGAVYFCCLSVLESAGDRARATISVRDAEHAVEFEVALAGAPPNFVPGLLEDRVEALGGRLMTRSSNDGARVSGLLPR